MEGMKSALLQPPAMWAHTLPEASLPVSMISEFPLLYIRSCYVLICFPELSMIPWRLVSYLRSVICSTHFSKATQQEGMGWGDGVGLNSAVAWIQ